MTDCPRPPFHEDNAHSVVAIMKSIISQIEEGCLPELGQVMRALKGQTNPMWVRSILDTTLEIIERGRVPQAYVDGIDR